MALNQFSFTEENYLKTIYKLSEKNESFHTSTSQIAEMLDTTPPSVTDMLRRLTEKRLVTYARYKKVALTPTGKQVAILIIRKHRLWEVFLHDKLKFAWDEVHEVAEELEHIHSEKLIARLEKYLGFPKYDPHGDPIPSASGELKHIDRTYLSDIDEGKNCSVVGVEDSSAAFLQYLQQLNIGIGTKIKVLEKIAFDGSVLISLKKGEQQSVSRKFAENVLVAC